MVQIGLFVLVLKTYGSMKDIHNFRRRTVALVPRYATRALIEMLHVYDSIDSEICSLAYVTRVPVSVFSSQIDLSIHNLLDGA